MFSFLFLLCLSVQFENTTNKVMLDLSSAITILGHCTTVEVRHQLQLMASEASNSQEGLVQELDRANQQDMQELQVQLEGLVGGQAGLMLQLVSGDDASGVRDGAQAPE